MLPVRWRLGLKLRPVMIWQRWRKTMRSSVNRRGDLISYFWNKKQTTTNTNIQWFKNWMFFFVFGVVCFFFPVFFWKDQQKIQPNPHVSWRGWETIFPSVLFGCLRTRTRCLSMHRLPRKRFFDWPRFGPGNDFDCQGNLQLSFLFYRLLHPYFGGVKPSFFMGFWGPRVAHFGLAAYEMAGFGVWLLWLQKGWLGLLLYRCIYVYMYI